MKVTEPLVIESFDEIDGDMATQLRCTLSGHGRTVAIRCLRVARDRIVVELNDHGLGVDTAATVAAMKALFARMQSG